MKKRQLLIIALILLAQNAFAQYVNNEVQDHAFSSTSNQTITHDVAGNIVFFSFNTVEPNHDVRLIKLDPTGNPLFTKRIFNDTNFTLTPVSIIHSYDDGFILIGTYDGANPGSPFAGSHIHTTFYAKYDNAFTLVWFNLLYGYPFNSGTVSNPKIDAQSIIAIPDSISESYMILSLSTGYNKLIGASFQAYNLSKISDAGLLTLEKHVNCPNTFTINNSIAMNISYLSTNNLCAVTSTVYDASNEYPCIFSVNPTLTTISPFTHYSIAGGIDGFWASNVIENAANPTDVFMTFGSYFTFAHTSSCTVLPVTQSLVLLKMQASSFSTIFSKRAYIPNCLNYVRYPLTVKNIPYANNYIMTGFTEGYSYYGGTNFHPVLLRVDTLGSVFNMHRYNVPDYFLNMQSFDNYLADSFIVHVNQYDTIPNYTRIMKTDAIAKTYCADTEHVFSGDITISSHDTTIRLVLDTAQGVLKLPNDSLVNVLVTICDTGFMKPAIVQNISNITSLMLYPNPATNQLNIVISDGQQNNVDNINITNAVGQVVLSRCVNMSGNSSKVTIDVSNLPGGLYFIVASEKGQTISKKTFVKL